ncbi:MAG: sigma-70 family RNA polymerase sigma factor [Planctomycetota bacterium]|jgi:RNA polymerase sigma factor (sigma-70 family)
MRTKASEVGQLRKCLQGDSKAFEGIVATYQELVCAITYSGTADVRRSEELAHQTFINAWHKLSQLRDLSKFRPWLCTIARNHVKSFKKGKKRDILQKAKPVEYVNDTPTDEPGPLESAIRREHIELVNGAIGQIPEEYREPLVLYYRQQQSVRQVALLLDLREEVVKKRLQRGRKMIKEQISSIFEETLSATGPKKAFTVAVITSIGGMAIEGSGVAAAAGIAAASSSTGAATGGTAVMSGVTAKIITAAAVIAIGVGAIVTYESLQKEDTGSALPVAGTDVEEGVEGIEPPLVEEMGTEQAKGNLRNTSNSGAEARSVSSQTVAPDTSRTVNSDSQDTLPAAAVDDESGRLSNDANQSALADEALFDQQGLGMVVFVQAKETGEAISDANLEAVMRYVEMTPPEEITLKTSELGFCRVEFGEQMPIEFHVRITKPGYTPRGVYCNEKSSIPGEYTFQLERGTVIGGRVIDEEGEAVEGAFIDLRTSWINLDSPNEVRNALADTVRTDANGKWSADIVPADLVKERVSIRVRHPDYFNDHRYSGLQMLATIPAMRSQKAQFVLRRGFAVSGDVVDTAGNPIEGACVELDDRRAGGDPKMETDGNGQFRFDEPQLGKTRIKVDADGYAPDMQVLDVNASTEAIEFVLEPGNRILGRVIDVNGNPVEGAFILISDWRSPHSRGLRAVTDHQGRFEWNSAPADEVEIHVRKNGFMSNEKSVVASDEENEIILYRPLRAIGEVLDAGTSEPIDKFDVTARTLYRRGSTGRWRSRHTGGLFEVTFDSFGPEYEVEVKADNYEPFTSRRFTVDEGTVELKIRMVRCALENLPQGTVYLPDSNVAAGAEVRVTTRGLGSLGLKEGRRRGRRTKHVLTDPNGHFTAPVQPERFDLLVIHDAGYSEVSQEQLAESHEIHLNPWGRVEGTVSAISGPVAYERVGLSPEPWRSIQGQEHVKFTYTAATDEHGRFVMDRVIAGRMRVRRVTRREGGMRKIEGASQLIEVVPGETTRVELVEGRTVVGKLVISDEITGFEGWEGEKGSIDDLLFEVEVPVPPEGYATMTPEQRNEWRNGLGQHSEQEQAWKMQKSVISRSFQVASDGSFQIDDVRPGNHRLYVDICATERYLGGRGTRYTTIGEVRHAFTVPEIDPGREEEPLDLGVIVIEPFPQPDMGADVNAEAFVMAAQQGDTEMFNALLEKGTDVNIQRKGDGWTALMAAAFRGHIEIVKALLEANADVNIQCKRDGWTALMAAAFRGHIEIVKALLEANADVNIQCKMFGGTALWHAAVSGHTEVVKVLLEKGADVNAPIDFGATPLLAACVSGHLDTVILCWRLV